MQYCGKTENDRTIISCIRIYIQKVKKKEKNFFPKNSFFEELWPLDFLGFSYIISFVKYDNGKPEHDMSIHYVQ